MSIDPDLKHLPLEQMHVAAGAKFGPFAGWSMPITYLAGVMKEHLHVREKAGLFDISHMKLFIVSGPQAADLLAFTCPIDAAGIGIGQSKYTFFLNDEAGILDDLIVTRVGAQRFVVVANAGNAEADGELLANAAANFDAGVERLDRVFLALQGPAAADVLASAGLADQNLFFMRGCEPRPGWFMSRSGYTGEDGFEIAAPAHDAAELVARLLADERTQWIGLAARDSLRLEAGLCLHGQDICPNMNPAEAGLMWAIPKAVREAKRFVGAAKLAEILEQPLSSKRVGLKPEGRQPIRAGAQLFDIDGIPIGRVTSGGFGPSVGHPVAMGYVVPALSQPGTRLFADVRGSRLPVDVHPLPFSPHRYRKG